MAAKISDCGQYRYLLERSPESLFCEGAPAVFLMLNPSIADATIDDPTIRRCRRFARDWGRNGLVVANIYAWRATDPSELARAIDPVGPENNQVLRTLAEDHKDIVCAWGANGSPERVEEVVALLTGSGARLWCLGTTKAGAPRHPLYVKADQPLVRWPE